MSSRNLRFPLDPRTVAHFLTEKGWVIPSEMAVLPLGGNFSGAGVIATRGSSQIRFNTEAKVLAIIGRQEEQVTADFDEVENVITDVIDFDSKANADYYEVIAEGYCAAGRPPLDTLRTVAESSGLIRRFDGLAGSRASLFGIHLMKDQGKPDDLDWWDLSLNVLVFRPEKYFGFHFVSRSQERAKVLAGAKAIGATVRDAVARLEAP
jgi:hypothetical protein